MLIIRRRRGESLVIGVDIEIEVLEVAGAQVKLGIKAPRDVLVFRREILLAAEANRDASAGDATRAIDRLLGAGFQNSAQAPAPGADKRT